MTLNRGPQSRIADFTKALLMRGMVRLKESARAEFEGRVPRLLTDAECDAEIERMRLAAEEDDE